MGETEQSQEARDEQMRSVEEEETQEQEQGTEKEEVKKYGVPVRGRPLFWSLLLALPFVAGGGAILFIGITVLTAFALPLFLLGGFVIIVGLYVRSAARESPTFREDEEVIDTRRPRYRVAAFKVALSMPFFLGAPVILLFTVMPYLWPTLLFFGGLFFFFSGFTTYCRNILTTYYLTDQRIISVYRFLSMDRKEIPLDRIRVIQERKSVWEMLLRLGNVLVATGGTETLQINVRHIPDPSPFAEELRNRSN